MFQRLLCLVVALFVCYQACKVQEGHVGEGHGVMETDSLHEADHSCHQPSSLWARLPLIGNSLAAMLAKKYSNCIRRRTLRMLQSVAVHLVFKVCLGAEMLMIFCFTRTVVERILSKNLGTQRRQSWLDCCLSQTHGVTPPA